MEAIDQGVDTTSQVGDTVVVESRVPYSSHSPPLVQQPSREDSSLHPPMEDHVDDTCPDFGPNSRAAQFYNVVEDLTQAPCVMSILEVLQICPTQHKNLLTVLGAVDPDNTNLIHFNVENYKPRLQHKIYFQIITKLVGKKVFRTVLDEGASTSVLSLTCWKAPGSPELVTSPTTL